MSTTGIDHPDAGELLNAAESLLKTLEGTWTSHS